MLPSVDFPDILSFESFVYRDSKKGRHVMRSGVLNLLDGAVCACLIGVCWTESFMESSLNC